MFGCIEYISDQTLRGESESWRAVVPTAPLPNDASDDNIVTVFISEVFGNADTYLRALFVSHYFMKWPAWKHILV